MSALLDKASKLFDRITMYRLMLYLLLLLLFTGLLLNQINILPYDNISVLTNTFFLWVASLLINAVLSRIVGAKTNLESTAITALILALTIGPYDLIKNVFLLTFVAIFGIASKYIFVYNKKHIFNPAVFAILASSLLLNGGGSWWIESKYTIPLIIFGGILASVKAKRLRVLISFLFIYVTADLLLGNVTLARLFHPYIWFFAFIMLIEPLTSPSKYKYQIAFGALTGLAMIAFREFLPQFPYRIETSLLAANLLFFILSKPVNYTAKFLGKFEVARNTWTFSFKKPKGFDFTPGQYVEITHPHRRPDVRGIRRFFTISSSPTEDVISFTMRTPEEPSSFKREFLKLETRDSISVSAPQGEFVMSKDKNMPLSFVAGGIGVTPFRSMLKYLIDNKEKRDIVLLYLNNREDEIAFKDLLRQAQDVGIKTFYFTGEDSKYLNKDVVTSKIPDYRSRHFYISGPPAMIAGVFKTLRTLNVKDIKTDFFPGY